MFWLNDVSGRTLTFLLALFSLTASFPSIGQEFRAVWVDTFNPAMRSASEVTTLVNEARAANFNAIIVEVRKRGDAYYNSLFEPKATDVSPQSFDPLADLIAKAHNTNNGARIEVHAWIVSFNIWNNQTTLPSQLNHPFRLHPEWLTQNEAGVQWGDGNYAFDPGHPGAQEHTYNVAMDIVSRYDVDGLNFDYIRYAGKEWGYNPVSVARFNERFGRTGQPGQDDPDWKQFRRDQVSAVVRKVYLNTIAIKPHVKISADTICFAPGPTSPSGWFSSAAWTDVLQDWRGWMEEGILDISIPMAYFDQRRWATAWTNWSNFAKDHQYNRHTAIGPGVYLNTMSNVLFQMRHTRLPSATGRFGTGVAAYSYNRPVTNDTPRSTFFAAMTQTNTSRLYETNATAIFATPATPPVMPWKTAPTRGHLKGFVTTLISNLPLDGATVTLTGPTNRTLRTDPSGFFGAVDLPLGSYTLTASFPDLSTRATGFVAVAGSVVTRNIALPSTAASLFNVAVVTGGRSAIITWNSTEPGTSRVQYGLTTGYNQITSPTSALVTNHSVLLNNLLPGTNYFFAVVTQSGTNIHRSDGWTFSTAGELIVDNTAATFSGTWITASSSVDKYGADYRYIGTETGGSTASAIFTPAIAVRGNYDVFIWYPQGGNRSTNTPAIISFQNGSTSVITRVNQEINGGGWRQVGTNLTFRSGSIGNVRIGNGTGEPDQIVVADAVRFLYRADQDTPTGTTVPDWWAFHYFGSNVNATADHDLDGYADWIEYLAGTNPMDAASGLTLALQQQPDNTFQATFAPYAAGRSYQLERKAGTNAWETLSSLTPTIGSQGNGWFTVTNDLEQVSWFRVRVDWAP